MPISTLTWTEKGPIVRAKINEVITEVNAWGGGDALTSNPLSQFASTTSAQLAGVISDETGSGALVFATSPTLVTPVLGVATATSINGATITSGTLNGSVTGTNTGDNATNSNYTTLATTLATANSWSAVQTFTSPLITNWAINFNAPEGFMVNGKIVPSVASGNLTLTLTGTSATLSATNPCYVMIGGVTRTITADIVVTANSGTLYLNAWSAELATKEIDYFPYCQWNTTTSAVNLLASRLPYAGTMADFNNSNTNEKWAIGIINYNSTNAVVNIWRFAATLSAGAGYTWSIPATSVIINSPIYETRWLDIVPTLTWTGTTAPSGVPTAKYKYKVAWDSVFIDYAAYNFTPWVAITALVATLPFNASAWLWKHTTQVSTNNDLNLTGWYIITGSLNAFCAPVSAERVWASATYQI